MPPRDPQSLATAAVLATAEDQAPWEPAEGAAGALPVEPDGIGDLELPEERGASPARTRAAAGKPQSLNREGRRWLLTRTDRRSSGWRDRPDESAPEELSVEGIENQGRKGTEARRCGLCPRPRRLNVSLGENVPGLFHSGRGLYG